MFSNLVNGFEQSSCNVNQPRKKILNIKEQLKLPEYADDKTIELVSIKIM